jgi:hypothetical protein
MFVGDARYEDIVPDARIVFSYTVARGETRITAESEIRERYQLASERPANPAQDREREEDSHEDRRHPSQPSPLEGAHDGTQEEREQDGQRQRDQHGLQPIQARND